MFQEIQIFGFQFVFQSLGKYYYCSLALSNSGTMSVKGYFVEIFTIQYREPSQNLHFFSRCSPWTLGHWPTNRERKFCDFQQLQLPVAHPTRLSPWIAAIWYPICTSYIMSTPFVVFKWNVTVLLLLPLFHTWSCNICLIHTLNANSTI